MDLYLLFIGLRLKGIGPGESRTHVLDVHVTQSVHASVPVQCGRNGTAGPQGLLRDSAVITGNHTDTTGSGPICLALVITPASPTCSLSESERRSRVIPGLT